MIPMSEIHPPTKGESVGRACGYLLVSVIGFYALLVPRDGTSLISASAYLGAATVLWSLFLISAIPAAAATLFGRWRVEFILLPLFSSGLAVACVPSWIAVFVHDDIARLPRTAVATALLCLLVVRIFSLRRVTKVAEQWTSTKPLKSS
jgi:hypothetical protein